MALCQKTATKRLLKTELVLAAFLLIMKSAPARADIILTLIGAGIPVGNDFQYTYSVMLTEGTALRASGGGMNTADFFTLYSIPGLISGSETYGGALATNSSHSEQPVGFTPVTETPFPPENPNLMNITTFWTGPEVIGARDLGTFSFLSTNPLGLAMLAFTAASQNSQDLNLIANNSGQVAGPGPAGSAAPEPGTLLLVAIGLAAVGGFYCCRRG